jgi:glutamate racemase
LIEHAAPDLVVIACNTASTLALGALRDRFGVPFVGTVPAIKVAAALSRSRMIGVLATPGTARREYTQDLISDFAADCRVVLAASPGLAQLAERKLLGRTPVPSEIEREIKPAFVDYDGKRTDVVVLACTHYPFLLDELAQAAPWPVHFIDPADAIARQAAVVLADLPVRATTGVWDHQVLFTADYPHPALDRLLGDYGLKKIAIL